MFKHLSGIFRSDEKFRASAYLIHEKMKVIAVLLLLLTAINAVVAGFLFIIDPSGQKMGISVSYLRYSPFNSFLLPGIILFVVNGLLNFIAAFSVLKNKSYSSTFVAFQGLVLCGWIIIQVLMVKDVSVLHVVMLAIGAVLMVCGFLIKKYGIIN